MNANSARPLHNEKPPRKLGALTGIAIVIGIVIGSGIFRVPAETATYLRNPTWILIAWVTGGAIALSGALSVAELAAMYPEAGGLYVYLREAFGPLAAFVYGWMWLVTSPVSWAAQAIVFSEYLISVVPMSHFEGQLIAALLVLLISTIQFVSVKGGAIVQNSSVIAKLSALLILSCVLWIFGGHSAIHAVRHAIAHGATMAGFGLALISILWAYDGWENLTALSGEIKRPGRNLPLALVLGTLITISIYLLVNGAFLHVLSPKAIAMSPSVAVSALGTLAGNAAQVFIAGLVMISVIGSLNGSTMSDPRVFFAMAEDNLFFRSVGKLHPRFKTPHIAILMEAGLALVFVFWRSFGQLAEAYVLGIWPFLALSTLAVFKLRRTRPHSRRPYRTIGYPWVPILFIVASLGVFAFALSETPGSALISLGITAAGIPLYFLWKFYQRSA